MINLNDYGVKELSQVEKVETNGGLKKGQGFWRAVLLVACIVAIVLI